MKHDKSVRADHWPYIYVYVYMYIWRSTKRNVILLAWKLCEVGTRKYFANIAAVLDWQVEDDGKINGGVGGVGAVVKCFTTICLCFPVSGYVYSFCHVWICVFCFCLRLLNCLIRKEQWNTGYSKYLVLVHSLCNEFHTWIYVSGASFHAVY